MVQEQQPAGRAVETPVAQSGRRGGIEWTPRLVIWTIILVLLLVFVLLNFDDAEVNLLFTDVTAPLAIFLLLAMIAGYALGWLRPHFRPRRR